MNSSNPDAVNQPLVPPSAPYVDSSTNSTPRDSYLPDNSAPLLASSEKVGQDELVTRKSPPFWKRPVFWLAAILIVVVVVLAVVLPVYFAVIKPNQRNSSGAVGGSGGSGGGSGGGGGGGNPQSPSGGISGGDGSTIVTDDGTKFTYSNPFGGFWVSDPANPYNDDAQPNSWTPPLNTSWTWGKDKISGVNIGGWFVLEPFISPALFQKYPEAIDEWSISQMMAADTASGGLGQLEDHYNTFITEQDIAQIAGAGLNWIRLPIPFWAIDAWADEPFLARTSWKYILRFLGWARKYGLRVAFDLHTIPGSQNGYNHSGKSGQIDFLNGVMGIANAQRTLNYIRIITEFITQSEYQNVVPMFGIVNEALLSTIGTNEITSFYIEAHNLIRLITGYGAGNGPFIAIHDGFLGLTEWAGYMVGSDRIALDTHPYFSFNGGTNDAPFAVPGPDGLPGGTWPQQACNGWAPGINTSQTAFGVTIAGEFSNGYNDCGLFLEGTTPYTPSYGDCTMWNDYTTWNDTIREGVMNFALASMDALQNYFFWTWKVGNSSAGKVEAPLWSYQLGLENGWMPKDPRVAVGKCASLGTEEAPFDGTYLPWQTGGSGAGTLAPTFTAANPWPPTTISNVEVAVALLPMYTPTGTVATLPPATVTATGVSKIDGWANTADNALAPTPITGCVYPDAWDALAATAPASGCATGA